MRVVVQQAGVMDMLRERLRDTGIYPYGITITGGDTYVQVDGGYRVPKELAIELGRMVQAVTDRTGKELAGGEVREIFEHAYLAPVGRVALVDYEVQHPSPDHCHIRARVRDGGEEVTINGDIPRPGTGGGDGNPDFLGQILAFQLTNPFNVRIQLSRSTATDTGGPTRARSRCRLRASR